MVTLPNLGVCIDRFEASAGPAGKAVSVAGSTPWTTVSWLQAKVACELAGKRLCTADEWVYACNGPAGYQWPQAACNYDSGAVGATAEDGCEGGYPGLFDMLGNVREITDDCDDKDVCPSYGGGFLSSIVCCDLGCAYHGSRTNTSWDTGFRCCLSL
jgi:formylglycine-generating enzyme required for sulfatase activity